MRRPCGAFAGWRSWGRLRDRRVRGFDRHRAFGLARGVRARSHRPDLIMLGDILCFEGFSSALVRRESITEDDRRGAMLMSMIGGALIALVVFLLAGPVWKPLFGARTAYLIKLVSPSIFVMSLAGVSRSTLWRQLDFRVTSIVDALGIFVVAVASIGFAIIGPGDRAIILGGLAGVVVSAALFMIASPPPMPRWSRASQRDITTFGIPAAFSGMAGVVFRNIDYAILAARLPASTVGIYYRAFKRQRCLPGQAEPDHVPDRPSDVLADRGQKGARGASRARRSAARGGDLPGQRRRTRTGACPAGVRPSVACGRSRHRDSRGRRRVPRWSVPATRS